MATDRKKYTYKIFSGSTFIADIDPRLIKSDFGYTYSINTFSAQLQIELSSTFNNITPALVTDELVTESGEHIVDEAGVDIAASLTYTFSGLPLYVGYYLEVWLSYDTSPNGTRVFSGTIMSWESNYGANDSIIVTVMSHGLKLKNYIIQDSASTTVNPSFNSVDPSDIVRTALTQYTETGGSSDIEGLTTESGEELVDELGDPIGVSVTLVTYTAGSVVSTGTTVSYQFQLNTLMEAVQKALELAPGGWYYCFDLGSGTLTFGQQALTADHTLVLGRHINAIKLNYSIDTMANTVYYSGGDDGSGENVLVLNSNTGSVANYGTWMTKVSDQRVTLTDTANLLSQGIIDTNGDPTFRCEVAVSSGKYDIETISVGQMIGFANGDSVTNSLLLQVSQIQRSPDTVTLTLSSLWPRVTHRIEDIKRNLDVVNALANPDLPS